MNKNKGIFYGWWIVVASAIILAIAGPASVAVANVYQSSVIADFGISASQFAIVNSIVLGTGIFVAPVMSQKYATGDFRRIYLFAIILYGVSYGLYSIAPNIIVFYLISFLVGAGYSASTLIPVGILINNWFVEKRGLAMSLAVGGLGIGGVIFSQLVTWSIGQFGWRMTYLLYAAILLIVCIPIVLFLIKAKPEDMGLEALGASKPVTQETDGETEQHMAVTMPIEKTFTKPFFIMLIAGAALVGIINNGGLGQFPPYLQGLHGAAAGATLISIYSAVGIAGKLILGTINDKFGIVVSTIYATVLSAIAYVLMIGAPTYSIAVLGAVVFGLGNAVGTVSPPLITSAIYSEENYAKGYGYVTSAVNLGLMLGSLVAASIADATGSYTNSWIVLAIISLVTGALWVGAFLNSRKHVEYKEK